MRPAHRSGRLSSGGGGAAANNRRSMSRSDMQSLSYSCLGQPRRQQEEEGDDEEGYGEEQYRHHHLLDEQEARRLSRNLSLSHESVFRIDSHTGQVSSQIFLNVLYRNL
jgi:hypothetical protein